MPSTDRADGSGGQPGIRSVSWTPPRPAQIPALHASLLDWLPHPAFLQVTCDAVTAGNGTVIPAARSPLEAAVILHGEEAERLHEAYLYAVDGDDLESVIQHETDPEASEVPATATPIPGLGDAAYHIDGFNIDNEIWVSAKNRLVAVYLHDAEYEEQLTQATEVARTVADRLQ